MNVLFETVHGSRAYGLATPASDLDRRGVFASPRATYFGFADVPDQVEPEPERVLWEVRKFFRLAVACNPTMIETLHTDPADHLLVTSAGQRLLDARHRFLSRRAGDSFGRYGLAQLKRIETHRRWLRQEAPAKPARADFGLPERSVLPRDEVGAAETMLADGRLGEDAVPPHFMALLERERRYRAALREYRQHQEWLTSRNPARAALEARFGYDTKHAMHLLRLLRMAVEILETGVVHVRRPDAEDLRAVRDGALSFEQLTTEADRLGRRVRDAVGHSALPERPDEAALDALCAEIVAEATAGPRAAPAAGSAGTHPDPHAEDLALARRFLAARGPHGALVAGVTGAHFYGFPSPDSDLDLKGIHLAPTAQVCSLWPPAETIDVLGFFEGREVDFTSHELGFALRLLLKGNGNILERLASPIQALHSPEAEELRALGRDVVSKRFAHHYRGFFRRVCEECRAQQPRRVKGLLYAYRAALTGVHLLRRGECVGDVTVTAAEHGFPLALDLVARKRAGEERCTIDDASAFEADWPRLEAALADAASASALPEEASNGPALSDYLVRMRRAAFTTA